MSFVNVDQTNPAIIARDHYVTENLIMESGCLWNSDDMVTFEQAVHGGCLDICTNDVEILTGRKARSVRELIKASAAFLKQVAKDSGAQNAVVSALLMRVLSAARSCASIIITMKNNGNIECARAWLPEYRPMPLTAGSLAT